MLENVLQMDLRPADAQRIMREIVEADNGRVFFKWHVEQRMIERGITRKQVYCCIAKGRIIEGPAKSIKGNWEMTLEVMAAGEVVTVVAALDHDENGNVIVVITAY